MELPSAAELLDNVLVEVNQMKPFIPTYAHLLASALFAIYTGTHASLTRPSSAAKPSKKGKDAEYVGDDDDDADEAEENLQRMEGLEPSDAIMFPIMSGLTLAGLYFLIKFLEDPAILNTILSWYFSHAGFFFAISFLKDALAVLRSFAFPSKYSTKGVLWKVDQQSRMVVPVSTDENLSLQPRRSPLPGIFGTISLPDIIVSGLWAVRRFFYKKGTFRAHVRSIIDVKMQFTICDVASVVIAMVVIGAFVFLPRTWWMTNILGFCFCYGALQFLSPTTFWTGTLILCSLFFYDIYFVFFTPMMVTVAEKLDIPIKLLFPRPSPPDQDPDVLSLAMLGLGDIVIPGTLIGLALRFDLHQFYLQSKPDPTDSTKKTPYVKASGGWGERFWTGSTSTLGLPEKEITNLKAKLFPKTYFRSSILGYTAGMVTTLVAMQVSRHPQPALLYLVPGVLTSVWMTAFVKGDIRAVWSFSDDAEEAENKKDKKDKKTEGQEGKDSEEPKQGLFRKVFFGTRKPDTKESSTKNDDDESQSKQKGPEKSEEADKSERPSLFDFSINWFQKPESEKEDNETQSQETQEDGSEEGSTSTSSSPVLVEREELSSKRRKGYTTTE